MSDVSSGKRPISSTWREWIAVHAPRKQVAQVPFDVLVVGSGYGGAVAALRLAQKGYSVLVVERGSEYLPGEFPNHFSQVPKYFRANVPGQGLPMGRATGLVEFSIGQGMVAVTGNGLGGGSLINAGVVMKPDPDVFAQEAWPAGIRHNTQPHQSPIPLDQAFVLATKTLGAKSYTPPVPAAPLKTQALKKSAELASMAPLKEVDLTVRPDRCIQCGDCASGCNVPEAKGDLRTTYLREAVATGRVQIVTQAEVYRFAPHVVDDVHLGWTLWVFATDAQHHKTSREEAGSLLDQETDPASTLRQIMAPRLIVSAGTLGSTQLLQRSQSLAGETLAFSPALGTRLSGNGDALSVMVQAQERVNAVGQGSLPPGKHWSPNNPAHHPHVVGPTITAALDARDPAKPLVERVVLEDGAIPGAIGRVFEELVATTLTVQQMDRWSFYGPLNKAHSPHHPDSPLDPLAASAEIAARSQVWLSMGHDGSPGRIVWLPGIDGSAMVMPNPKDFRTYQVQQALFDRLRTNGIHTHNPLWNTLPEGTRATMSGTKPPPTITSVHPLGGCPMSDDPKQGVVNELGQVWVHQPSHPNRRAWVKASSASGYPDSPATYPGLFVLDGSIVPTSLGCNPLLTITALAERAVSAWQVCPAKLPASSGHASRRRPLRKPRLQTTKWSVLLREELTAKSAEFSGVWTHSLPKLKQVALRVEFASQDFDQALKEATHRLPIQSATLSLEAAGSVTSHTYTLIHGKGSKQPEFQFLPAPPTYAQGRWPLVWTLGDLTVLMTAMWFTLISLAAVIASPILCWITTGTAAWEPAWAVRFLSGLILLAGALWVLPTGRTLLTWMILRGHDDIRQWFHRDPATPAQPFGPKLISMLKQLVHSREKREMHYDLLLDRGTPPDHDPACPKRIRLKATKRVVYRASIWEVGRWLLNRVTMPPDTRPPMRRSFWEQVMDADADIRAAGGVWSVRQSLFKGRLRMGLDNLLRPSTAQLGAQGDTTTGLLMLAGYALLALRFAFKTHVFDFRLPTFSNKPLQDNSAPPDVDLKFPDARPCISPIRHQIQVPRGWSSGDAGIESMDDLKLSLWQYRQGTLSAADINREGSAKVKRAKVVLLLHAFGQSGLTFTYSNEKVTHSLAGHLYSEGYEVWVLDSRMSTRSGYAEQPCNVDMMGEHDVPGAIDHIIANLRTRLNADASEQVQIALVAQCIGSASAWMAALSGRLQGPVASKIYALVSSQVHPVMHGSRLTQSKTWLPALLRHVMGVVPFAVRGSQDQGTLQFLDRLLSSLPVPAAERELSTDEDAVATCRRIRFIEAPLFLHQNMAKETVQDMPKLFGNANVRLFEHARRFVSHGQLVDEDGLNRYVTEENARQYITFPVMLLHGEKNELFDVESARASWEWLRSSGALRPCSGLLTVADHGHLDVMLGVSAHIKVFTPVGNFLNTAYGLAPANQRQIHDQWRLVKPIHGPVLGWIRRAKDGYLIVRSSLILDEGCPQTLHSPRPGFDVFLNGEQTFAKSASEFALVVNTSVPTGSAIDVRVSSYPVFRPSNGNNTPAYLALQIDVPLSSPSASFCMDILVFRKTQSLRCITTAQLSSKTDLADVIEKAADNFGKRCRLEISDSTLKATLPGQKEITIWASCCRYPGLSTDKERIDTALNVAMATTELLPAAAFLLGDQIYADATAGLVDPVSPIERYFERHLTAFNPKDLQGLHRLQRTVPTFMTPDDHEWVDNYPSSSPLLTRPWPDWLPGSSFQRHQKAIYRWAYSSIRVFQKIQGSDTQVPPQKKFLAATETGGLGPIQVFLLDSRYSRTRGRRKVISKKSMNALIRWLKVVPMDHLPVIACGSVLLPGLYDNADPANPGPADDWDYAPKQRTQLLEALMQCDRRFVLLSGDYHVSAVLEIRKDDKPIGLAVVAPPMYAPLPYANTQAHHLNLGETLTLAGSTLSLSTPAGGRPLSGSGLAELSVKAHSSGLFQITVDRKLRLFGEPTLHITQGINIQKFTTVVQL